MSSTNTGGIPALRIDAGQLGPAMKALPTDRMRAFVMALLSLGNNDNTAAANAAGYSAESQNGLRVTAHRLAHDERILAAVQEEARRRIRSGAIMASSHLLNIADNPSHKDQLKAIDMLLNRAGLHATSEHKVTVEHVDANEKEALARINAKMTALGFDDDQKKKMLGSYGITDVEFVEVVQPTSEGLEDLL